MRIELTKVEEATRETKAGQTQTGVKYSGVRIDGEKQGEGVAERFLTDMFDEESANTIRNIGVGGIADIKMVKKDKYWNVESVSPITGEANNIPQQRSIKPLPSKQNSIAQMPILHADYELTRDCLNYALKFIDVLSNNDVVFKKVSKTPEDLMSEFKNITRSIFVMLKKVRDGNNTNPEPDIKKESPKPAPPPQAPVQEEEPVQKEVELVPEDDMDDDIPF